MIEIDFFYPDNFQNMLAFQLVRFSGNEPWRIVQQGELLGSLQKKEGIWIELTGSKLANEFIFAAGQLIDQQHYNHLPLDIKSRWDKQIAQVIVESDFAYMVICKPGIDFLTFKGIFSRFLPGILKDEWKVRFRVFNADFTKDFELEAKPLKNERNLFNRL